MKKDTKFAYWRAFGLSLLFISILLPYAEAMPPHPGAKVDNENAAGKMTSYKITPAGLDAPSKLFNAEQASISGTFKALAVLVEFSDRPHSVVAEDFDTLLFENQMSTLRHYYREMSFDQLDIVTVNLPSSVDWVTATNTYEYYCNNQNGTGSYPQNSQGLCENIVDLINPVVDFSQYDNNGNGYVDALILIHTGPGAELYGTDSTNLFWSHKWSISPRSRDGVYISEYTIQPEYWYSPGDITCGVFCHEMGHIFGLPDLYDRDNSSYGVGRWSLMAYGSWLGPSGLGSVPAGLDAWSRVELGFNNYTNVTSNTNGASIASVESGGPIYRLWSSGAIGSEYFLVENRQRTGYDTYLPSDGVLIWHIDETKAGSFNSNNDDEWYPGYTSYGNYLVALEQSDGLYQIEQKVSRGNSGDPFPGGGSVTQFSPSTLPGSNSYAGDNTYVAVDNISASATTMTADFQVSLLSDVQDDNQPLNPYEFSLSQNYPNPFNPSTTIEFSLAQFSKVSLIIYDLLGREVEVLVDKTLPAGQHKVDWNVTENNSGISSGVYFYRLTTDYGTETRKMSLIK